MSKYAVTRVFNRGVRIASRDPQHPSLFLIKQGRVGVTYPGVGEIRGPNEFVGTSAIIDNLEDPSIAQALEDGTTLIEIPVTHFQGLVAAAHPLLRAGMRSILRQNQRITGQNLDFAPRPRPATDEGIIQQIFLANAFREAMSSPQGQLSLHYQPIVVLETGELSGFEALMRWSPQGGKPVSPADFIPAIEESDLIIDATRWALAASCKAAQDIALKTRHTNLHIAVNFSAQDLAADDFVETVFGIVRNSGLMPGQCMIEITERTLVGDKDRARRTLAECHAGGMHCAVDDFGTGYSSLSYLHDFPIGTLKIDRSFVSGMLKDPRSRKIVKTIIQLGQDLGAKILAEGVETADQALALRALGCDLAQGWHFGKPLPQTDAIQFVQHHYPAAA